MLDGSPFLHRELFSVQLSYQKYARRMISENVMPFALKCAELINGVFPIIAPWIYSHHRGIFTMMGRGATGHPTTGLEGGGL